MRKFPFYTEHGLFRVYYGVFVAVSAKMYSQILLLANRKKLSQKAIENT